MMTTISTPRIRTATPETSGLGDVLARAFQEDPVFTWWIPDADRRRATLPPFFDLFVETFLVHDLVYVDADTTGTVVWGPPSNPLGIEDEEAFGVRMEEIVAETDLPRVIEIVTTLAEHHPSDPHYYLQWAAVLPEHQGRGIGSVLLAPVLQRCDREGVPAYTEATSLHNCRLYERHGFAFISEIAPADGPPLYRMWREPTAHSRSSR
ncbi:GNAT family N-acetyltransferase [Actinomycetospora lutea]|uniref:GNAT family N-acetyltransferase n=1 Tax=Actinomycetospora lutea TaxID=663604 RepID=UPI002366B3D9|nr:GNAT family N-acetyltransferase [Actinomycetospora lutea]MDD7939457.1 GNAT family N-acetyltransferase [Actinomycetospora lutea]